MTDTPTFSEPEDTEFEFGHLQWYNGEQTRLANLHEFVRVSVGTLFIGLV